jgi:type IV secretion system protein VirB6
MNCPALRMDDSTGFAAALDIVDCRSGPAIAGTFSRLFGAQGALLPALTVFLTLYVAVFAIGLLTGRSRLGISALTPRVLTLGMVLTFATSWVAYQNVVQMLAVGAPDELATLLAGTHGSATGLFARGLDHVFRAIAEAARDQQAHPPSGAPAGADQLAMIGPFSGPSLLWLSAIILLLGTVGTLIVAKIALAGLLAIGPLFIVLALFRSTWGLFEGWLKALVLLMVVPLFVVLIGGGALAMIVPVIRIAVSGQDEGGRRAAIMLLLATCIYSALIVMVIKVAATIVAGWRLPFAPPDRATSLDRGDAGERGARAPLQQTGRRDPPPVLDDRVRTMLGALPSPATDDRREAAIARTIVRHDQIARSAPTAPITANLHRASGIGSRFRAPVTVIDKGRLT